MATMESIAEMKYNFIHDFINLNDRDKVNKVIIYFNMIMSDDNTADKRDDQTRQFLKDINGLWVDDRGADEIVADIYSARSASYQQRDNELAKIFKQ